MTSHTNGDGDTFVRVTNREIYEVLKEVHDAVLRQNGSIRSLQWQVKALWAALLAMIGSFIGVLARGG